ncbi:MAG: nitrate reductase [Verrucomicrobiales bacterium]|nr:nitrate reductase [Verrucomicrobiales bacterium]
MLIPSPKSSWFRQWSGPLTQELIQRPGEFGLGTVPENLVPDATTTMVCGYCSTGCGLNVHLRNGAAVNLSAASAYPVNLGMACPKGWEALAPLAANDRLTMPLYRAASSEPLAPISWGGAMDQFCGRFKELLRKHGPESIAFLSTGQICTEEMAFLGALFKFGMGGIHCDSNTRQCMATSHVAYRQSFGFDAPPYTYEDFEQSDVLVFIGSNLCIAHPILWQRVLRNRHRPEIIVIDPRATETAMNATLHLPIAPKSDLVLLYGLAWALIKRGAIDWAFVEAHTTGFTDFIAAVESYTEEVVCLATGLPLASFGRFVDAIIKGQRVSFWWTMGVNQGHQATRTAQAIINLALMTGNMGRPGTGANSITGQCNAMGSRLFANATSLLGGRDVLNPEHRAEVAGILGIPQDRIVPQKSLAYDEIVARIRDGRIKGLWVIGTNPSHSWIQQRDLNETLSRLEFLVVQDMYGSTETARQAHLVLPAAGWGEKDGTLINSERRIGLVKKVARAPGQALSDFQIFRLVAAAWGCGPMFERWNSPEATFQILKQLSAGRPCDISGIADYRMLDEAGGIQWPFRKGDPLITERRLFENGRFFTPDGRAVFLSETPVPVPEPADEQFPFVLLTGRGSSSQWHTLTRTNKSEVLKKLAPSENYIEMSPQDVARLGLTPGRKVSVVSRRATVDVVLRASTSVKPGECFMPMHFVETNQLTLSAVDPHSRQPSYKHCAIAVTRHGVL